MTTHLIIHTDIKNQSIPLRKILYSFGNPWRKSRTICQFVPKDKQVRWVMEPMSVPVQLPGLHNTRQPHCSPLIATSNIVSFMKTFFKKFWGVHRRPSHKQFSCKVGNENKNKRELCKTVVVQHQEAEVEIKWSMEYRVDMESLRD